MTLRKQEWRSLADAGRLYETMASFEFLQKCAKALKINEKLQQLFLRRCSKDLPPLRRERSRHSAFEMCLGRFQR